MHPQPIPADTLDPDAVAVLLHSDRLPLLTVQGAWDALKRARGQHCDWHRLNAMPSTHAAPAIRPVPAQVETVADVLCRTAGRAKRLAALRVATDPNGGAA